MATAFLIIGVLAILMLFVTAAEISDEVGIILYWFIALICAICLIIAASNIHNQDASKDSKPAYAQQITSKHQITSYNANSHRYYLRAQEGMLEIPVEDYLYYNVGDYYTGEWKVPESHYRKPIEPTPAPPQLKSIITPEKTNDNH